MFEVNSQTVRYHLRDLDRSFKNQKLRPYHPARTPLLQSPVLIQISVVLLAVLAGGALMV